MKTESLVRRISLLVVLVGGLFVLDGAAEARATPECQEGGSGSSYCSYAGCEVTCNSGYYACCNLDTGCKCVPGGADS